jgi:hypothetical protein
MALAELLRKAEAEPGLDVLREGVRVLAEALMEVEVEQHLGAGLGYPGGRPGQGAGDRSHRLPRIWCVNGIGSNRTSDALMCLEEEGAHPCQCVS